MFVRKPCSKCKGNKYVSKENGQPMPCPDCGGKGYVVRKHAA